MLLKNQISYNLRVLIWKSIENRVEIEFEIKEKEFLTLSGETLKSKFETQV